MKPELYMVQLAKIVVRERRRLRLSRAQLAQRSRLALSTIRRIETCQPSRITLWGILRLGRALGGRLRIKFLPL
jgi:ribosome-binding protein aMBF1 (putative translation factor)